MEDKVKIDINDLGSEFHTTLDNLAKEMLTKNQIKYRTARQGKAELKAKKLELERIFRKRDNKIFGWYQLTRDGEVVDKTKVVCGVCRTIDMEIPAKEMGC